MDNYEINRDTLIILPYGLNKSKIIEKNQEIIVNKEPMDIIKYNCEFYGSTYEGRHFGTKSIMNITHKSPIIIEESRKIICFPTASPRQNECAWVILNPIKNFYGDSNSTNIIFDNNLVYNITISIASFENQISRSYRLESILRKRLENF
ncbi:MAG: competence protein ComK [Bacilli bacterium]|nr:competence protein ComK [Bacilli bacterium]